MKKNVCFSFFILCAILCQGIVANFLEKDVGESSKRIVRQKRVIDRTQGGELSLMSGDFKYVAIIKKSSHIHCVATILSESIVITAARCANGPMSFYTVTSGSVYNYRGIDHNVTSIKKHGHSPSRSVIFETGIALMTVYPPFEFNHTTGYISLHSGLVLEGMRGIVSGWGNRIGTGPIESRFPRKLRSISLPIINHQQCQRIYTAQFPISDEDFCTYHPEKLCANTDAGAPFVMDNQLVGIHVGPIHIQRPGCSIRPDVFILLQHSNYITWISRTMHAI